MSLPCHHGFSMSWTKNLEFIIHIQERELRVVFMKAFEFNSESFEVNHWFELSFEEVSMRMIRIVDMSSLLMFLPLGRVIHAYNIFMNSNKLSTFEMRSIFKSNVLSNKLLNYLSLYFQSLDYYMLFMKSLSWIFHAHNSAWTL